MSLRETLNIDKSLAMDFTAMIELYLAVVYKYILGHISLVTLTLFHHL